MFSRAEREFLHSLTERGRAGSMAEPSFPNPSYRRKLLWGIRRKVQSSLSDIELLVAAARVDPRVLPNTLGSPSASPSAAALPPVFVDPVFVGLVDWWRKATRRSPSQVRKDERSAPPGRQE